MSNFLARHSITVGSWTLVSRALGFLRDVGMAIFFGTSFVADAFLVAFKLPNLFRRLFAEGALTQSFIPIFQSAWGSDGRARDRAFAFASHCGRWLFVSLLLLVLVFEYAMPQVMGVLAPGFSATDARLPLAIDLARWLFPFLLLSALAAWLSALLNVLGHYALASATSVVLNAMILLVFGYHWWVGDGEAVMVAYHVAYGVLAAGVIAVMLLLARVYGLGFRLSFAKEWSLLKRMMRLAVPVALGAGVYQLGVFIDVLLATLLPQGSVSYLYYADRLAQLPLGVVGVALGTVLLPELARLIQDKNTQDATFLQHRALVYGFVLAMPAAVALAVIAEPLMVVLFVRGAFDMTSAVQSAAALQAFALGIPAFVWVKVFAPAFFARQEMTAPVIIAVGALCVNVALSLSLMGILAHVGLALATSVASWLQVGLLLFVLRRRRWYQMSHSVLSLCARITFASAIMGGVLAIMLHQWSETLWYHLPLLVFAGMTVYLLFLFITGVTRRLSHES